MRLDCKVRKIFTEDLTMRLLLTTIILISFSTFAGAGTLSLSDLVGKFKGTPGSLPASITLEIFADGHMKALKKVFTQKALTCEGSTRVSKRLVIANLRCENGDELTVNLDMSNVTDLDLFNAPLWTEADRSDLRMMKFKRLQ
jgi:hypothetical protein